MIDLFELPATFCGKLQYKDPDGNLVCMSSDDEVKYALLGICGGNGQTQSIRLSAAYGSVPTSTATPGNAAGAHLNALARKAMDSRAPSDVAVTATDSCVVEPQNRRVGGLGPEAQHP